MKLSTSSSSFRNVGGSGGGAVDWSLQHHFSRVFHRQNFSPSFSPNERTNHNYGTFSLNSNELKEKKKKCNHETLKIDGVINDCISRTKPSCFHLSKRKCQKLEEEKTTTTTRRRRFFRRGAKKMKRNYLQKKKIWSSRRDERTFDP